MGNTLILVRGLPGSGKSTYAKKQCTFKPNLEHVEDDMFFMVSGEYKFDKALLQYAHTWCQMQTAMLLHKGKDVIVSSTFVEHWEIKPYITIVEDFNIKISIIEMTGNYGSIHDVPPAALEVMHSRWEPAEHIIKKTGDVLRQYKVV